MRRLLILIAGLSGLLISAISDARPTSDGRCADYDFSQWTKNGEIDTNNFVRVLRHNAPLYPKANSTRPRQQLKFGEALLPIRINSLRKRIQVRTSGTRTPLGWMEGQDLLCGLKPLQSDKGLDRKVFIKTPDSKDPSTTVPAYPSYQGPCNGRCKQLSRFRLYFIYAEDKDNQRYLVIDSHTLEGISEPPSLVGWVESGSTIPWNTKLGMRPREEVEHISLQSKNSNREGIELGGGNIWYTLPIHIPILDINQDQQLYHVAAPGIGFEGFKQYENVLTTLKLVDVFFLIDGTASMGPYIKAARQAVENIAYGLRNEPNFRETSFRFGFRIYRDTYADNITGLGCSGGICEGMPLSTTTCQSNSQASEDNWQAFVSLLDRIKETRNDQDDYPEKLFNGMRQAIEDMEPCPDRTKILFVIGDHGDKQREWPHDLVDDFDSAFDRKVIFFIQTPKARKSRGYRWAYKTYRTQAFKLLDRILPTEYNGIIIPRTDYFLSLNQTQLATQVVEQVKKYSPSGLINELEQALAGGEALQTVLKRSMKAGGMPILYWKWIEETGCSELGRQCQTSANHRVVDFYISTDKRKVQEEVWMTTDNLEDWLNLLRPFEDLVRLPVRKQRAEFVRLLRKQIQDILGGYPRENITLSEIITMARKDALPMREDSPLLQYTIKEIREEIEGCEVLRLIEWVNAIRNVLQKVYHDSTQKVVFTLEYPRSGSCPLTAKGRKVPKLKMGRSKDLGPDETTYRYDHTLYNNTVYWLPVDYLP